MLRHLAIALLIVSPAAADELTPRPLFPKPTRESIAEESAGARAFLKLVEGSGVRLRGERLTVDPQKVTPRLRGIAADDLSQHVAQLNAVLARHRARASRFFTRDEEELDAYRENGERASRIELGDQNLFFLLTFEGSGDAMIDALVELNALDVVEEARPLPRASDPVADKPPTTPPFVGNQGYLGPAPEGINVLGLESVVGGLGQGIVIADVETGWTPTHEDLKPPLSVFQNSGLTNYDHGTAVLGELVGIPNAYGIRGIAPGVDTRLVGHTNAQNEENVANAIDVASAQLSAGDVILIENEVNCHPQDPCPSEYLTPVFVAVQNAVAAGRVVVAAAGNGGNDLDDPRYEGKFNPQIRDSGAILVGAGSASVPHSRLSFSNYGQRVNAQGWGHLVTTTGYGHLWPQSGGDPEQEYTNQFNGTSSASPFVAGAAAILQAVRKARGLTPLTSRQMRAAVIVGATPQGSGGNIGPLPNVAAAVGAIAVPVPQNLDATGTAASVTTSWSAAPGASSYELFRRTSANAVWTSIAAGAATTFVDTSVASGNTYLYAVQALDGLGNRSANSSGELATTLAFTDPAIVSGVTIVKAKHIIEVRTAANSICTFAGASICPAPPFSGSALDENVVNDQTVTAGDFLAARSAVVNLRSAVAAAPAVFRETPAAGGAIKRIHMEDLRIAAN